MVVGPLQDPPGSLLPAEPSLTLDDRQSKQMVVLWGSDTGVLLHVGPLGVSRMFQ